MPKTLTRAELYDLVWSRPRTALAKELGISDVAIGKHCALANVPKPPVGYWAKLSAGGRTVRFPLPLRLPGQRDIIVIGKETWHWPPRESSTEQPVPPSFAEDIEVQVAAAVKRVGRVMATRDLAAPHRSLGRVLEAEAKRRAKYAADRWEWHKPHFDEPVFQRHLRIFNSVARAMEPLYGPQTVREEEEWVQGRGTLHHLVLHLGFGGVGMSLRVHEPGEPRRERAPKPVSVTTLRVESGHTDIPLLEWSDKDGERIEGQFTEIVPAPSIGRATPTGRSNSFEQHLAPRLGFRDCFRRTRAPASSFATPPGFAEHYPTVPGFPQPLSSCLYPAARQPARCPLHSV